MTLSSRGLKQKLRIQCLDRIVVRCRREPHFNKLCQLGEQMKALRLPDEKTHAKGISTITGGDPFESTEPADIETADPFGWRRGAVILNARARGREVCHQTIDRFLFREDEDRRWDRRGDTRIAALFYPFQLHCGSRLSHPDMGYRKWFPLRNLGEEKNNTLGLYGHRTCNNTAIPYRFPRGQ